MEEIPLSAMIMVSQEGLGISALAAAVNVQVLMGD